MPKISFSVDSSLPPDQVLAAAADCSERRPELWPNISPKFYEVRERADTYAVVREGSEMPGGRSGRSSATTGPSRDWSAVLQIYPVAARGKYVHKLQYQYPAEVEPSSSTYAGPSNVAAVSFDVAP